MPFTASGRRTGFGLLSVCRHPPFRGSFDRLSDARITLFAVYGEGLPKYCKIYTGI